MRVLLTADTLGGVWDYAITLATELHDSGNAVLLAAFGEPQDGQLRDVPPGVELAVRDLRLEWMKGAEPDIARAGEWLLDLARRWRAHMVHLNQFAYAVERFTAPTVVVAHSDVLSWWSEVRGSRPPLEWLTYERWVRAGLRMATAVVAPSLYQSDLLARHYGRGADRVIWNGIRLSPAVASQRRGGDTVQAPVPDPRGGGHCRTCDAVEDAATGQPPVLLVSAGRAWDPAKGIHHLEKALAELGGEAPEAFLLGETTGPDGAVFHPCRLRAVGRVAAPELRAWLARASLYVAPSLYEPFGLGPLEGALHGCALILSDIASFRELWGEDAAYFPPGDSVALAGAIAELIRDPPRRNALARGAQERTVAHFSSTAMAVRYHALYRELLREGRAA